MNERSSTRDVRSARKRETERDIGDNHDRDSRNESIGRRRRKGKPPREAFNIQFANGLPTEEVLTLLQYELLRARDRDEEVHLPRSIVHSIKYRLNKYYEEHGEVEMPKVERAGGDK